MQVLFEMAVRKVAAHGKVNSNTGKIAFERGPLVYCAEAADNPSGVLARSLEKNETFQFEFDKALFNGTGKIVGTSKETAEAPMTLIPYYAWSHRSIGEMAVWLKAE